MTPDNLSPDLLLFGPDVGLAAVRGALRGAAPHLSTVEEALPLLVSEPALRGQLAQALERHRPRALFLASATLTAELAEELKAALDIPVYGITPALAHAARLSCTRHVALLARADALAHPAVARLVSLHAERGLRVTPVSASDLVYPAHRLLDRNLLPDIAALRDLMAPVRADQRIDTVILASTHAHLLRALLEKAAFRPFYWVDSLEIALARMAESLPDGQARTA